MGHDGCAPEGPRLPEPLMCAEGGRECGDPRKRDGAAVLSYRGLAPNQRSLEELEQWLNRVKGNKMDIY